LPPFRNKGKLIKEIVKKSENKFGRYQLKQLSLPPFRNKGTFIKQKAKKSENKFGR
jgi:hypothetical protein